MTTTEKILDYLAAVPGEMVPVTHFTEAYGVDATRLALFALADADRVRLTVLSCVADFLDLHVADESDLITVGGQTFGYVTLLG